MAVALYVLSTASFSGKSAVCTGLARQMMHDGLRVGYMKPVNISERRTDPRPVDEDVDFMTGVFGLTDPIDLVAPISINPHVVDSVLEAKIDSGQHLDALKRAYRRISRNRDVVVLEGSRTLGEGGALDLAPIQVVRAVKGRALVVIKYASDLQTVDEALVARRLLGPSLLGVVLNAVPYQFRQFVTTVVRPALETRDIRVYGILSEEHLLSSISVREVVELLGGQVLSAARHLDELVENLMVGAMHAEAALSYFRRKPNKAVVTGGDRLDIQLAALETSTRCLILTGDLYPSAVILSRAEEVGVPVVLVRQDTLTAVDLIGKHLGRTRFHQPKKIEIFDQILKDGFRFDELYRDLNFAPANSRRVAGEVN